MSFLFPGLSRAVLAAVAVLSCSAPVLALTDPAPPASEPATVPPPVTENAPQVVEPRAEMPGLDAEQVYAILVGEIAGRRGDMATAFLYYLRAAQLTKAPRMAELAVRAAISADDDEAAGRGVRLWLELAPETPEVHQVAAFLRIKAGDREGALIHLVRLVELTEGADESVFEQAADIIARAPSPDTRLALMEALAGRFPESADAQQSLAMVAANVSRFDVADRAARRALELRPDWNQPRLFLVRLLLSQGKRDEARRLLEEFVERSPDDHGLHMLFGQFLVEEHEFATARDVFEQLLSNRPKAPDVLFAVGILSLQLDDLSGARIYFTRLFETGERQDDAAFYLGQTAERAEDARAAIEWYDKVKGANLADAQVRMAFLRAKAGEVAQAREILNRLRGDSPDDAIALYLVEAEILDEVGRVDEAMSVFGAALEIHRDDRDLLYARGLYAVEHGQLQLGEQDFLRILASDPEHADTLNALGYTLADRTDRYQEALGYIEKAYALKPEEPAILDSMGWVHYRLGQYEVALDYLRRALDSMDDGEIAAHLGEVLWAMGQQAEAWSVWEAALRAHPEHEYLRQVVGRHRVSETGIDGNAADARHDPQDPAQ
ncbi:tetratricopeptide repeat protein [Thiocystis violascens]|uniref:Flp pilus assembly protein TadD n=1 Tax=Thiocystis violascens (strain ATCC 17096 / DSM 198 / 6111) TaxID=765911 RepID=I3YG75_THIV6|nr:tetratricopeptide repeat protein [Thiocystis violascens]AFL75993.1 Flp pilus assembly protein TadD [Thiocystis violascens DSM 198]